MTGIEILILIVAAAGLALHFLPKQSNPAIAKAQSDVDSVWDWVVSHLEHHNATATVAPAPVVTQTVHAPAVTAAAPPPAVVDAPPPPPIVPPVVAIPPKPVVAAPTSKYPGGTWWANDAKTVRTDDPGANDSSDPRSIEQNDWAFAHSNHDDGALLDAFGGVAVLPDGTTIPSAPLNLPTVPHPADAAIFLNRNGDLVSAISTESALARYNAAHPS